jgi:hypothetical protein
MTYKNMKIAITNPEYSVKVREKLRDEGYDFAALQWNDPVFVRAGYLYTYDSGLVMKGEADRLGYFKGHPNEEYVLVGDELKKASEYFKQPETPQPKAPPLGLKPKKLHDQERLIEIIDAMYRYVSTNNVIPAEWFAEAQYLNGQLEGK